MKQGEKKRERLRDSELESKPFTHLVSTKCGITQFPTTMGIWMLKPAFQIVVLGGRVAKMILALVQNANATNGIHNLNIFSLSHRMKHRT